MDIGSVVRKGDELARIERADYELRVRQAEAVLAQARAVVGLPLEGEDVIAMFATLCSALGVGLLAASGASYRLSRRLGLLRPPNAVIE